MRNRSWTHMDLAEQRRAADALMRSFMDPADVELADRMDAIRAQDCSTPRDDLVKEHLRAMKRSLISTNGEKNAKILFITGESNSGKTRLIDSATKGDPTFRSYRDSFGEAIQLLRSKAPAPCTQRNLGIRFVNGLGLPVEANIRNTRVWPLVDEQIRFRRARWIFLDEAQRALKINDPEDLQQLSDNLVSLVDAEDWPIRMVILGVDPLPELRIRDTQMEERSKIIELTPVPLDKTNRVEIWLVEIVVDHAGLELHSGEFTPRTMVIVSQKLIHGCAGNAGSIIELIRSAVEAAIVAGRKIVMLADFAQAYRNRTRCLPHDNIFELSNWEVVPAGMAKMRKPKDEDDIDVGEDDDGDFKKPKPGDRPR